MSGRRVVPASWSRAAVVAALFACGLAVAAQAAAVEGLPAASAPQSAQAVALHLPEAPAKDSAALLPVPIPAGPELRFLVDPASVSRVGLTQVRYTLEVLSSSGVRNLSYEGIDCANDTWHVYATWSERSSRWQPNPGKEWLQADVGSDSDVHGVLDRDYWCSGRWAAGDAATLVARLRRGLRPQPVRP